MQLATSFPGLLPVQSQGYSAPAADWFLFRCWRFSAKRMLKRCFHSHWASCSLYVFVPWPCSTATLLHLFQCCCPICWAAQSAADVLRWRGGGFPPSGCIGALELLCCGVEFDVFFLKFAGCLRAGLSVRSWNWRRKSAHHLADAGV